MATIIRAWVYSVFTCIGVLAVFASIMQALTGRWEHAWHNPTLGANIQRNRPSARFRS